MYNAEKYIGDCLNSIKDSGLPQQEIEIIVIDDGSKDNGIQKVETFANDNNNILLIKQANQGQSVARNNGIDNCHGQYIWCVDSDDKISNKAKCIIKTIKENPSLDILAFQLQKVSENGELAGKECMQTNVQHGVTIKGRDAIIQGYNPSSVCALAIKREFMNQHGIRFYPGITHQDVELSYRLFVFANSVLFIDCTPYIYIFHSTSTSQSINVKKKIKYLSDECIIIDSFTKLAETFQDNDEELYKTIIKRIKSIHFGMAYNLITNRRIWRGTGIIEGVVNNMRKNSLFPLKGDYGSIKKNLASKIFNIILSRY